MSLTDKKSTVGKLFDEDGYLTVSGMSLHDMFSSALYPIMGNKTEKGYSIRDIAHVVYLVVHEIECDLILGLTKEEKDC